MATSDNAVGLYSGLTADQAAMRNYNQSFTQTGETSPVTTNGTSSERSSTSGTGITSSSQLNTTPTILGNLESFIQQMTDRPAISQAELDRQAPLATSSWQNTSGGGSWVWTDPSTGRQFYSSTEAQRFNTAQQVKRQQLIQQAGIIKGGTEEQRAVSDARLQEIERNRVTQAGYTKDAAFTDAKALSAYFQRTLMEQQLPGILRGAEGAGTSQGSMRALLQTRAAEVTAEQAAKIGIDAASSYGQINNQLAGTLEALTRQDPNSISAQLLQALSVGKGIATSGSQVQSSSQSGTKTGTQQQVQGPKKETQTKNFIAPPVVSVPQLAMEQPNVRPITGQGTGQIVANSPEQAAAQNQVYATPSSIGTSPTTVSTNDEGYVIGD